MKNFNMTNPTPKLHSKIDSIIKLSETFAFYAKMGTSSEIRI